MIKPPRRLSTTSLVATARWSEGARRLRMKVRACLRASLADVLHRRLLLCLVVPSTRPRVMDQTSPGGSCASLDAATGTGRLRRTSR